MNIKEVSQATGLSKDMIRYYESEGLISPSRNETNQYRSYSENDCYLLVMIKLYSSLGISLKQIRSFMLHQDINLAGDCITQSILKLEQEKLILEEKIKHAKTLNTLLQSKNEYEFVEEKKMYFYPIKDNDKNNMPILFEKYGSGIPICKINIKDKEYTYDQGFLFHQKLSKSNLNYILLEEGTYCHMTCKVPSGKLIDKDLLEPKLQIVQNLGYQPTDHIYTYLIMGNSEAISPTETIYITMSVKKML